MNFTKRSTARGARPVVGRVYLLGRERVRVTDIVGDAVEVDSLDNVNAGFVWMADWLKRARPASARRSTARVPSRRRNPDAYYIVRIFRHGTHQVGVDHKATTLDEVVTVLRRYLSEPEWRRGIVSPDISRWAVRHDGRYSGVDVSPAVMDKLIAAWLG